MATTLGAQPGSAQGRPTGATLAGSDPLNSMTSIQSGETGGGGAAGASNPQPATGSRAGGPAVEELDVYGDVPMARFGHTITLVSKTKVVLFGGATGDTGKYSMTGETYLFNILTKTWSKLNGKLSEF